LWLSDIATPEPVAVQVAEVVARALDHEPGARFATPAEMSRAIDALGVAAKRQRVGHHLRRVAGNVLAARRAALGQAKAGDPSWPALDRDGAFAEANASYADGIH
jgi:hypothetical protein